MIKKIIIVLFILFVIFLFFKKPNFTNLEGNNWIAEKVIINNKDFLKSNFKLNYTTRIYIFNDKLEINNMFINLSFYFKVIKNKYGNECVLLKSGKYKINNIFKLETDTIEDRINKTKTIITELISKDSKIKMYKINSTYIPPTNFTNPNSTW